jgi:hypothetical protein
MSHELDFLPEKYQKQVAAQLHAHNPRRKISNPKSERHQAAALDEAVGDQAACDSRPIVRFTLHRVKPLDPDNAAGSCKDLLDGLRHAGLIPGDEAWRIRFETEQEKVAHYTDEKTVIEIITP